MCWEETAGRTIGTPAISVRTPPLGGVGAGVAGFFHQLGEFLFAGHGFSSWGFRFYFFGLIRLLQTFGMAG